MDAKARRGQVRIGFLAQENIAVPPPIPGASVSRVVYELARRLPSHFDVTICSLPHPSLSEGVHDGIRYLHVPAGLDRRRHRVYSEAIRVLRRLDLPHRELQGLSGYGRRYALTGLRRLAAHDPHVVHLQNISHYLPLARRIVPGAKLVLHMHPAWLTELPRRTLVPQLRDADLILGVSEFITDGIRRAFPEVADRCRCLYNGVDCDDFVPRASLDPERLRAVDSIRRRWRAEGPVVLSVGTWAPEKGTDVLLSSFRHVLAEVPEATLVLLGTFGRYFQVSAPPGRAARAERRISQKTFPETVRRLARDLGDRVILTDKVDYADVPLHYAAADVYAMPSVGEEPFSLTVLEALACGLPVVGSRSGGIPEIVHDGKNGFVVPVRDESSLADALVRVCRDPDLAARLGRRGRSLVATEFSWRKQSELLAHLYDETLSPQPLEASPAVV